MSRLQQDICKCVLWYFAERLDKYELDCSVIKMIYSCLSKPDLKGALEGRGCWSDVGFFWGNESFWDYIVIVVVQHSKYNKSKPPNCLWSKNGKLAVWLRKKSSWFCLVLLYLRSCVAHTILPCVMQLRMDGLGLRSFCHCLSSAWDLSRASCVSDQQSTDWVIFLAPACLLLWFFFEIGSYVAQAGLRLTIYPRMTLNSSDLLFSISQV